MQNLEHELKTATEEVKKIAELHEKEYKNLGKANEETKASADRALTKMHDLTVRLEALEQKSQRSTTVLQTKSFQSLGQEFIENEKIKSILEKKGRWSGTEFINLETKTITTGTPGGSGSTALVPADRQNNIIQIPQRKLLIRDLLMPGSTNSDYVDYVKETAFENNAAFVAENPTNPKPTSDLTFSLEKTPVQTLAHMINLSNQVLSDAAQLQTYINGRMIYGLNDVEDRAFLMGDGENNNIKGIFPQASSYTKPDGLIIQNETLIDRIRAAYLQVSLTDYAADAICLYPTDVANLNLVKDTQNRYIFSSPTSNALPTLWGLPICETKAITQGSFLVGAFKMGAQIFDREGITIMLSNENRDNFEKNMVTLRAEKRLAFAVTRPDAFVKGTTSDVPVSSEQAAPSTK